jgi:phospholipase/carboxylesterase
MQALHSFGNTVFAGASLATAKRAMILVHGRGDDSDSMMLLAQSITDDPTMALVFPKATNNTWYPKSFMAPTAENEPWLSSALENLNRVMSQIKSFAVTEERIFLFGFSQGACLALDFACRHATRYAGIMILSGGLIGPVIDENNYQGNFAGTSIFMGCSDVDFHIPLQRFNESAAVAQAMGAAVDRRLYPGMGHTINEDELRRVRSMIQI